VPPRKKKINKINPLSSNALGKEKKKVNGGPGYGSSGKH
jgi:hypothetical protein